jgi:hypothetical protein
LSAGSLAIRGGECKLFERNESVDGRIKKWRVLTYFIAIEDEVVLFGSANRFSTYRSDAPTDHTSHRTTALKVMTPKAAWLAAT